MPGFLLHLDPAGGEGGGSAATELPKEIEWGGQKYNPAELLEAHKEYNAHKDDLKNLEALKQDSAAYADIAAILQSNPQKLEELKVAMGRKMAGLNPWDSNPAAAAASAAPPKPATGAKKEDEPAPVNPELIARMDAQEQVLTGLRHAEGQRIFEAQVASFQNKFPAFKDPKMMDDLYAAGRQLTVDKTREYVNMGYGPDDALNMAKGFVGNMSHEQIMMSTPMRKHYEEQLLKGAASRPGLPGGVGTGAERLGGGQPGPTPELDAQLLKRYSAAKARGDNHEAARALEDWATATGKNPLEVWGFSPEMAAQLTGSR